jgi:hypothetical protein
MTAITLAQEADQPEPAEQAAPTAAAGRWPRLVRQLVITSALLVLFAGALASLIAFFQPLADGAGGCGGG